MLPIDLGGTAHTAVGASDAAALWVRLDAQIGCVQLADPVPARFHWPRFADLRVNSMNFRPYSRQLNVKIGNNIRDDPASIGT